jgi:hypothetical protein
MLERVSGLKSQFLTNMSLSLLNALCSAGPILLTPSSPGGLLQALSLDDNSVDLYAIASTISGVTNPLLLNLHEGYPNFWVKFQLGCNIPLNVFLQAVTTKDCLCGLVVRVPSYRSGRPGVDSRALQGKKKVVGLERGLLSLVSTTEELLGRNSSGSGLEIRE